MSKRTDAATLTAGVFGACTVSFRRRVLENDRDLDGDDVAGGACADLVGDILEFFVGVTRSSSIAAGDSVRRGGGDDGGVACDLSGTMGTDEYGRSIAGRASHEVRRCS